MSDASSSLKLAASFLVCGVWVTLSGCSVFGIRTTQEAPYTVVVQDGPFEVREYEPLVVAETTVVGSKDDGQNQAFRRLFDYIRGDNTLEQKIAMTAPVFQQETAETPGETIDMTAPVFQEPTPEGWRMTFVLPKGYTLATAPRPSAPEVTLREVPGRRIAAVRYTGSRSEAKMEIKAADLREWIEQSGMTQTSAWWSAGYDPPFTLPFLRRNEILAEVVDQNDVAP